MKRGFAVLVSLLLMLVIFVGCQEQEPTLTPEQKLAAAEKTADSYYEIDPVTANYIYRAEPNLIILDVSQVYLAGHLPNAINIPADKLQSRLDEIDVTRPYLVYGQTETESAIAAKILAQATQPVYRLVEEYNGWAEQGFELDMKKCHLTYGSTPAVYKHTHVWCEEDGESKSFCINEKCHTHRLLISQNLATDAQPGPHNHFLQKP